MPRLISNTYIEISGRGNMDTNHIPQCQDVQQKQTS